MKTIGKLLWQLFIAGFLLVLVFFGSVRYNLFGLWGDIPDFKELENPNTAKASVVYSSNHKELGKYFSSANRVRVPFEEISPYMIKCLIATEDERFEQHAGIDGRSLLRVLKGILTFDLDGGGSTITQQLAKNLFKMRSSEHYQGSIQAHIPRMIGIKIKEWITSIRLERAYTKQEIITMYLNTVDHGVRAMGVYSGARVYFNTHCKKLNIQQAATLVGTYAANYAFDPISNPEKSTTRRNQVLAQLLRSEMISMSEFDSLKVLPLLTTYTPDSYNQGIATYFREHIKKEVNKLLDGTYDLSKDGLKIYTTLDYDLQRDAEQTTLKTMQANQKRFLKEWGDKDPWDNAFFISKIKQSQEYKALSEEFPQSEDQLWEALRKPRSTSVFTYQGTKDSSISVVNEVRHNLRMLRGSMMAVDVKTGHVKVYVGGIDKQHYAYDMVSDGNRQVGSTFKPILYALAISNGFEPCTELINVPKVIKYDDGSVWEPRVPSSIDGEKIYLKDALKKSLNNIAAQLVTQYGADEVINYAQRFEINTSQMQPNLSLVLGTSSIPMNEIIRPYQTIANLGKYVRPVEILKIENESGKVLYQYQPHEKQILNELDAYKMITMLRGVASEGTAANINSTYKLLDGGNQIGGKTGTTQGSKDCWFIGFTKDLAIASWVGPENNNINYRNTNSWYGGRTALPLFAEFLTTAYARGHLQKGAIDTPQNLTQEFIDEKLLCTPDSTTAEFETFDVVD